MSKQDALITPENFYSDQLANSNRIWDEIALDGNPTRYLPLDEVTPVTTTTVNTIEADPTLANTDETIRSFLSPTRRLKNFITARKSEIAGNALLSEADLEAAQGNTQAAYLLREKASAHYLKAVSAAGEEVNRLGPEFFERLGDVQAILALSTQASDMTRAINYNHALSAYRQAIDHEVNDADVINEIKDKSRTLFLAPELPSMVGENTVLDDILATKVIVIAEESAPFVEDNASQGFKLFIPNVLGRRRSHSDRPERLSMVRKPVRRVLGKIAASGAKL